MEEKNTELNHERRILILENKLESFISSTDGNLKEIKKDIKEIEKRLNGLGNGGFRKIILETNEKLLQELLERDNKNKEYDLKVNQSQWKYIIEKYKVVLGFLGGAVGLKIIDFIGEMLKNITN